jgi:hypothetical protein
MMAMMSFMAVYDTAGGRNPQEGELSSPFPPRWFPTKIRLSGAMRRAGVPKTSKKRGMARHWQVGKRIIGKADYTVIGQK